jgi:hypothetical protein
MRTFAPCHPPTNNRPFVAPRRLITSAMIGLTTASSPILLQLPSFDEERGGCFGTLL